MNKTKGYWLCALVLLLLGGIVAFRPGDKYFKIAKSLDQMAAVYKDLNTYYVDSLDPVELMESAIKSMTQGLDPYTIYYPEDEIQKLEFQKTGSYAGIGASFQMIHDSVVISSLFSNAPFAKAGFHVGDIILSLDGKRVTGMSPNRVHKLLRGEEGTTMRIKVKRPWKNEVIEKLVKREIVNVPAITYKENLKDGVGYIKLRQFTEGSAADFKDAFYNLQQDVRLKGLIIDLRGNPGGLLREAVRMSNFFLPLGDTIVSVRGRSEIWNEVYTAIQKPIDTLIPLVILINGRSASAAEIFAGAMQDLDRGVIIGQKSFGKGLVQGTRELPYHSELKLTVGRYYTPSGRCIQKLDYHHRDEYGSPVKIIDSIEKHFTTINGRVVHNNGGITPDKLINQKYLSNLSNALINNNLIFLFAARYVQLHPVAPELGQFQITDSMFEQFKRYVGKHSLAYRSRGEQLLERIKAYAIGAGYYDSVESSYNKLAMQVRKYTHPALKEKKQEISELLAKEIMNCYYRLPGKTAANLSQSPVIDTAIGILSNQKRYDNILR